MRNCFFYYIYFLCKLQYNFHVIHFFVKITNHCLVLFVIFHIKHQSFPLRALSSSGYSQSASLRSSTPNNCSAVYQLNPVSGKPCYNLWSDFITKACLCRSDQEKTLSEHLNFYLIFILQLTTGCCNTFDELLLEDQIQYDHRDTCKQRCCHQLRIIVGVLSLHFCKCC